MESIVSPWIIYLLGMVGQIQGVFILGLCLSGICLIVFCGIALSETIEGEGFIPFKEKYLKSWLITGFICFSFMAMVILTPSRNTIIAMYAANEITYNRAEKAIEAGKDLKNMMKKDIIEILESFDKKKNEAK